MKGLMESGEMEGLNNPVRSDVREMAYAKMLMRELGLSHKEAMRFIMDEGLDKVISMFQKKDPDEMEENFETIRGSMGKIRGQMKELEYE